MTHHLFSTAALAGLVALGAATAVFASPYSDINAAAAPSQIMTRHVRGRVSMLDGSGGEITVLSGPEGILLVDAGIAVSQMKIEAALHAINPGKLRYVVLTHWHWDHSDGDDWVRRAGASIIADKHTVERLSETLRIVEWEHTFQPVPQAALPNVVLTGDKTMRFAGETVRIHHYKPSHTDRGSIRLLRERRRALDRRHVLERRLSVHRLCNRRQHRRGGFCGKCQPRDGQADNPCRSGPRPARRSRSVDRLPRYARGRPPQGRGLEGKGSDGRSGRRRQANRRL